MKIRTVRLISTAALAAPAIALLTLASCGRGQHAAHGTDLSILEFDTATVSLVVVGDIAFLDSAGVIRSIRAADPCETDRPADCPSYTADTHHQFALELNAGVLQRLGADTSARLLFEGMLARDSVATH